MIFGRFFCGWVCPLGTLLDYFHRIVVCGPLSLWERVRVRAAKAKDAVCEAAHSEPRSRSGVVSVAASHTILSPDRGAIGRRVRLSVGRLRRSVFAAGARNDFLGRSAALSRSGCLLRLGRRRLGHEHFAAVGEETPAPVPPDGVSPGRSVGGASGDYFCPRIGGPPVLVPVSLSGRGPVRPAGPPVAGKTDSGQGLQGVRPVRGRLPHGRPRSDRGPDA